MSHFANDVHHRVSTRISEIIPDFVESEYPAFVSFIEAYYEFLEQHDTLPTVSSFVEQLGVVTVQAGNSIIVGANTHFTLGGYHNSTHLLTEGIEPYILQLENNTLDDDGQLLDESSSIATYSNNIQLRVGSDDFRIRSITSNTELVIYQVPIRSYFANTHLIETNKSIRQASGAARQIATIHEVDHTLDDFISYFRDTYLRDIPQGLTDTKTLLPRILDFYQSKGSEKSYQFLFQSLYGEEVMFSYPRESVFTTSDNEYVRPTLLRISHPINATTNASGSTIAPFVTTGNVALLETREIVGLTSNARATVLRSVIAYEGDSRVVRAFISEPLISREVGGLLLEDGAQFLVTKYGVPPEGLASEVYTHTLVQELVTATTFLSEETVSTIPTNDPNAITGVLLGSITGFTIVNRGSGYQINDLVYPPTGFGGVGRISAFTDVDLTQINIDDAGLGYYAGLPLLVDNTGTGGGSGLVGYVTNVSPGQITLHASANTADGDVLTFVYETDGLDYTASREKIDYYQLGISLSDLFGGLLLDDASNASNDGDDLLDEEDYATGDGQLLQQTAITIGDASWNSNSSSAIYNANLSTIIVGLTSNLSTLPVFVNGVRTEVGEINHLTVENFGSGYVAGLPTVSVQTPVQPTSDNTGLVSLSYEEIFGEAFDAAAVSVSKEIGQIGEVEVVTGGSGYSLGAFNVNSSTSTTTTGTSGQLGVTLGALSRGVPYFKNTRSFVSADQHLQDVTKYQPFSYVLTVEESLSRYSDILRRLVHPAGGLLLPRQTITVELDLNSIITFGGVDIVIQIAEDFGQVSLDPNDSSVTGQSLYTIHITAPTATAHTNMPLNVLVDTITSTAPTPTVHLVIPVVTNTITLAAAEETTSLVILVTTVDIQVSAPAPTVHLVIPVVTNTIRLTAVEPRISVGVSSTTAVAIQVSAPAQTMHLFVPVATNTITITAAEETTSVSIFVTTNTIVITASAEEFIATIICAPAINTITTTAPTATAAATIPATSVVGSATWSVEPNFDIFFVPARSQTDLVVEPNTDTFVVPASNSIEYVVEPDADTFTVRFI